MTGQSEPYPLLRGGRPRKSWCYAGLFGEELMLCAAQVRIGPARQAFWAVWDRRELHERTLLVPRGRVRVTPVRVEVPEARIALALRPAGTPREVTCPSGAQRAWTRKTPLAAEGTVAGRPVALRGMLDESAGHHARRVSWRWSAGVGELADGRAVAWNLVTGINDPPTGSERAVWIDGELEPEPPPSAFDGLDGVDGLRFRAEATRARRDRLVVFSSDYEQPFGTFTGTLPGGHALARAWGVMERHDVRW